MPTTLLEQEARRDTLSESTVGAPIKITATTDATANELHNAIAGHLDAVWIQVHNGAGSEVDFNLVINPATSGSTDLAAATVTVAIPPKDSLWVLQGDVLRHDAARPYTLAGFSSGTEIRVTGYIVRSAGGSIH